MTSSDELPKQQSPVDDYDYDDDDDDDDDMEHDDYYYSDEDDDAFDAIDHDPELDDTQNNYVVLRESNIRKLLDDDVATVSNVLSVSPHVSCTLLRHFTWSVSKVEEAWFLDEEGVRKSVGLLENPVVQFSNDTVLCEICLDWFPLNNLKSTACGHPYCEPCWEGYIRSSINEGPGCLALRCPDPSCRGAVGQDMINSFGSDKHKQKYSQYLLRSYIEDRKDMKWCPAPGCECAINYIGDNENYNVTCLCGYEFCWNCTEECHRPVNCETVTKWILKNTANSNNMDWMIYNSKPCPKCKRPIEKNQGCSHMTCVHPCNYEFCWLCFEDWEGHEERWPTGSCNQYVLPPEDAKKRKETKQSHRRFLHYYQRWQSNQWSREKAVSDLSQVQKEMRKLSDVQCIPENLLKFIPEAWDLIVEGRRVLKWTYAYGYLFLEHDDKKRELFEYLQGEAESSLERVHHCVEKELQQFLTAQTPSAEFNQFQTKLWGFTRATKTFFENLIKALENGISDVTTETTI